MRKLLLTMILAGGGPLFGADIFLAGDSTCASYSAEYAPKTGWGQVLPQFCRPHVKVMNYAVGGSSTKSFRAMGQWNKMLSKVKAKDFVVIQFGHNNRHKDPKRGTTPQQFSLDMTKFVQEAKTKGAFVVLATPIQERRFSKGKFVGGKALQDYARRIREVGKAEMVPVIDLNEATGKWITTLGEVASKTFFLSGSGNQGQEHDEVHVTGNGALAIAEMFVQSAKMQKLSLSDCFK